MAQSIKTLKIKRNVGTYASLAALTTAVKDPNFIKKPEIASMTDGELIMFRYLDENGKAATLMGTIYNPNDTTKEIHLEMSTAEVKELIKQGVGTNAKINVSSTDKVLELDGNGALSSTLSIVREGNTVKLLGKRNTLIGSFNLPTDPSSGATTAAVSLNYKADQALLQLIKDDDGSVISEVDFPFETMVQASELTLDNRLKLTFNTSNGTQDVIVDLNKLKDIYTSGDSTILVSGNKVSTRVSSKTTTFPITKVSDGLWIDDTSFKSQITNITNRVSNLEAKQYTSGDNTIVVDGTQISTKLSTKTTLLPLKKDTDGLGVDDSTLKQKLKSIDDDITALNNAKYVAGDPTIQIVGNRISTILATKNVLIPLIKANDGLKVDATSLQQKIGTMDNDITNLKNKNYTAGDSTIDVSGTKISTKLSLTGSYLPLIKKNDGLWVDDSDYRQKVSNLTNRIITLESKTTELPDVIDLGTF